MERSLNHSVVLVVDDEPQILRLVGTRLQEDGFAVLTASNSTQAIEIFETGSPDAIILDIMLPGMDGLEIMEHIRQLSDVPIILLTARRGSAELIQGLNAGADDYVTKPFNADELIARLAALLRRAARDPTNTAAPLTYEHVSIDLANRVVLVNDRPVQLTRTEWTLLVPLASNPGRVMLRDELVSHMRGPGFRDDTYYLRTWISRLRSKLEIDPRNPKLITTYRGIGYRLEPPDTPS